MATCRYTKMPGEPSLIAYLMGRIDFDVCLALQHRLVYEAGERQEGSIQLLLCEHTPIVGIGRLGSRAHVAVDDAELRSAQIEMRWLNRGGGCLLHGPGQLAVYPIVPLERYGWTVGEYLDRLQTALRGVVAEVGVAPLVPPGRFGVWGRSGQLAAVAAAVKYWVAYQGAFLNVAPISHLGKWVYTDFESRRPMGSLAAECQRSVRMSAVRESVVRHVSAAFGVRQFQVFSGHPLWPSRRRHSEFPQSRVG